MRMPFAPMASATLAKFGFLKSTPKGTRPASCISTISSITDRSIDLAFADFSVAIPQMQGGTLRGIGLGCFVESSGAGPSQTRGRSSAAWGLG